MIQLSSHDPQLLVRDFINKFNPLLGWCDLNRLDALMKCINLLYY
jgi:hypothetical protein